tara:strand:- start:102 stop:530 length:429 start_codon:yes stop_codon:yes gene_type:complete
MRLKMIVKKFKQFFMLFLVMFSSQASAQSLLSNVEVQAEISAAIEASPMPQQLDQVTVLESMKLFGVRGLQYNYKLGLTKTDLGGEAALDLMVQTMKNQTKNVFCNNPAMLWYKTNFVELNYVYRDKDNAPLMEFRLTPNDC